MTNLRQIAQEAARLCFEYSYHDAMLRDVLLFGSTLRQNKDPEDIDLVILHKGWKLEEFDKDPYGEKKDAKPKHDKPIGEDNLRQHSSAIFHQLGYRNIEEFDYFEFRNTWDEEHGQANREDFQAAFEKAQEDYWVRRSLNSVDTQIIKLVYPRSVDDIFDVHVLSTVLFGDERHIEHGRREAMRSCRDPTFWYTVLTEGRLYDSSTKDFTLEVDEKYPGATELFVPKKPQILLVDHDKPNSKAENLRSATGFESSTIDTKLSGT